MVETVVYETSDSECSDSEHDSIYPLVQIPKGYACKYCWEGMFKTFAREGPLVKKQRREVAIVNIVNPLIK
jgi:hypothetical protein